MKKITLIIITAMILASCNRKYELYTYDGDTTIVYSLLEVNADTNFFRITKSSLVNELSYKYDEIDVKFAGLFKDGNKIDTVTLDTVSKMQDGQLLTLYFTTKKLLEGEEYNFLVFRKADGVTVSAKVKTICHFEFEKPKANSYIDFKSNMLKTIEWKGSDLTTNHRINAGYFEVTTFFHYRELMPGATDTVERSMEWKIGSEQAQKMFNTMDNYYFINYTPSTFFAMLEKDEYLKNNSPLGVQRWLKAFEVKISVTGEELYYYNVANSPGNTNQDFPNYTNINNGIGMISSCSTKSTFHIIEQLCRKRIAEDYLYGFYYDPNL